MDIYIRIVISVIIIGLFLWLYIKKIDDLLEIFDNAMVNWRWKNQILKLAAKFDLNMMFIVGDNFYSKKDDKNNVIIMKNSEDKSTILTFIKKMISIPNDNIEMYCTNRYLSAKMMENINNYEIEHHYDLFSHKYIDFYPSMYCMYNELNLFHKLFFYGAMVSVYYYYKDDVNEDNTSLFKFFNNFSKFCDYSEMVELNIPNTNFNKFVYKLEKEKEEECESEIHNIIDKYIKDREEERMNNAEYNI